MRNVYLVPGFMASDLGILSTGEKLWWDPNLTVLLGLGALRLAPDGQSPGPPDGLLMAVDTVPQSPWGTIVTNLQQQLDPAVWQLQVASFDWRQDLGQAAASLANNIRVYSTPAQPATIVGHSAGGLVAVLAWAQLAASNQSALVRRIISICTPFQGSYGPLMWLAGVSPTILQMLALNTLPFVAASATVRFTLAFLNGLALTWPTFYELFPALGGTEAIGDPNRILLYNAANFPGNAPATQYWLDYVKNGFQTFLQSPDTFPPQWVMTCVVAGGLSTVNRLQRSSIPLDLYSVGSTMTGDSIVTTGSQTRESALVVNVTGSHSSVPLAITTTGLLANLILDPRGPLTPPPPPIVVQRPLPINVSDPPENNPEWGLTCIGGHC